MKSIEHLNHYAVTTAAGRTYHLALGPKEATTKALFSLGDYAAKVLKVEREVDGRWVEVGIWS